MKNNLLDPSQGTDRQQCDVAESQVAKRDHGGSNGALISLFSDCKMPHTQITTCLCKNKTKKQGYRQIPQPTTSIRETNCQSNNIILYLHSYFSIVQIIPPVHGLVCVRLLGTTVALIVPNHCCIYISIYIYIYIQQICIRSQRANLFVCTRKMPSRVHKYPCKTAISWLNGRIMVALNRDINVRNTWGCQQNYIATHVFVSIFRSGCLLSGLSDAHASSVLAEMPCEALCDVKLK